MLPSANELRAAPIPATPSTKSPNRLLNSRLLSSYWIDVGVALRFNCQSTLSHLRTQTAGAPFDAGVSRRLYSGSERGNVLAGWGPEESPVLSAELGWALVPDPECRLRRVEPIAEHQSPRLLEAEPLLVLKWTQPCHRLEVQVERRRTEPHVLGKSPQRGQAQQSGP